MRSDTDIKRDVEGELRGSPYIDATGLAVTVNEGTIELAGFVKRCSDSAEAEKAAKRVAGVAELANEIEIRLPEFDQDPGPDIPATLSRPVQYFRN